jgi:hypothetical protein
MNRRAQLIAAWCGPAICVLFGVGALVFARFMPPEIGPGDTAVEAQRVLIEGSDRIRIGLTLMLTAMALMPAWGTVVACQLRDSEGKFGVLTYIQIASCAAGTALAVSGCVVWGAGAYRPAGLPPEFARFSYDLGWHFFLWAWQPFSVWCIAVGMAIIGSDNTVFPRWSAYICFWTAFLFSAATGLTFFKDGAFSYKGLLALWMVLSVFFVWIIATSLLTIRNVKAGAFHTFTPAPGAHGPGGSRDDEVAIRSLDIPATAT